MKPKQTYIIDEAAVEAALERLRAPESDPDHRWEADLPELDDLPEDPDDVTVVIYPGGRG